MKETYACYLVGIDLYGDEIIERFTKEDDDYLKDALGDDIIDIVFRYYKSNQDIIIENKNYYGTSCIFFIGTDYNNKCKEFINEYSINIIKILKNKGSEDGEGVYYSGKYEEIFDFLRIFTLALGKGGMMADNLINDPNINDSNFFKFNNYKLLSIDLDNGTDRLEKVLNIIDNKLRNKHTKCFLRIIANLSESQIRIT